MNDKTREQIEAMKNQTIGVEIEMNNITREKAARKVAEYFGTRAWNAPASTDITAGLARMDRAGFGNSRGM